MGSSADRHRRRRLRRPGRDAPDGRRTRRPRLRAGAARRDRSGGAHRRPHGREHARQLDTTGVIKLNWPVPSPSPQSLRSRPNSYGKSMSSRLAGAWAAPYYPRATSGRHDRGRRQGFPMLNSLRKYATGWVAQLLMGILVLSFAVWGVSDIFTGFRSNAIAQGRLDRHHRRRLPARLRRAPSRTSAASSARPLTPEQARQIGIPSQVLGRLVNQATLDDAAPRTGSRHLERGRSASRIATDPQFFGTSGTFDRGYLTQLIRAQGLTEDEFITQAPTRIHPQPDRSGLRRRPRRAGRLPARRPRVPQRGARPQLRRAHRAAGDPTIAEPTETRAHDLLRRAQGRLERAGAARHQLLHAVAGRGRQPGDVTDEDAKARYDASPTRFTTRRAAARSSRSSSRIAPRPMRRQPHSPAARPSTSWSPSAT